MVGGAFGPMLYLVTIISGTSDTSSTSGFYRYPFLQFNWKFQDFSMFSMGFHVSGKPFWKDMSLITNVFTGLERQTCHPLTGNYSIHSTAQHYISLFKIHEFFPYQFPVHDRSGQFSPLHSFKLSLRDMVCDMVLLNDSLFTHSSYHCATQCC